MRRFAAFPCCVTVKYISLGFGQTEQDIKTSEVVTDIFSLLTDLMINLAVDQTDN